MKPAAGTRRQAPVTPNPLAPRAGQGNSEPRNPEYNVRRIVMMLDSTGGAIVEVQPVLQAFKFPD
jgi:hypothetical protein